MGRPEARAKQAHRSGLVVGRISMTRHGYGFVEAPEGDFYVSSARHERRDARRHRGDPPRHASRARQGRQAAWCARRRARQHHGRRPLRAPRRYRHRRAQPTARIRHDVFVAPQRDAAGARSGDIVVARLTAYPSRNQLGAGLRRGDRRPRGRSRHPDRDHHPRARACAPSSPRASLQEAADDPSRRRSRRSRASPTAETSATGSPSPSTPSTRATSTTRSRIEHIDGPRPSRRAHRRREPLRAVGLARSTTRRGCARRASTSSIACCRCCPRSSRTASARSIRARTALSFSVDMTCSKDGVVRGVPDLPERHPQRPPLQLRRGRRVARRATSRSRTSESEQALQGVRARRRGDRRATGRPRRAGLRDGRGQGAARRGRQAARGRSARAHGRHEHDRGGDDRAPTRSSPATCATPRRRWSTASTRTPTPTRSTRSRVVLKEFDYPIKDIHGATPADVPAHHQVRAHRPEKYLINSLLLRALERARYVDYLCAALRPGERGVHATSRRRSAAIPTSSSTACSRRSFEGTLETDPNAVAHGARARVARRALVDHGARGRDGRERLGALQALRAHGGARSARSSPASSPVSSTSGCSCSSTTPPRASSTCSE